MALYGLDDLSDIDLYGQTGTQNNVPLGTIDGIPSSNTASPFYVPPAGYIQADNGQIVPKNTINQSSLPASSTASGVDGAFQQYAQSTNPLNVINNAYTKAKNFASGGTTIFGISLENSVVILVGLILIAAGVFAFDRTQSVINTVAKNTGKILEAAAAS